MIFIESSTFSASLSDYLVDEDYRDFQQVLVLTPAVGAVIPGCGGLRKMRFRDPQRGKGTRGGLRVIYLYLPEHSWIFLLDIYGKNEKDDLSREEKRMLARLASRIKDAAKSRAKRG